MGSGLSRNRAGRPFSWRLSGNTWLFWVVCNCKRTGDSMKGMDGVQVSVRGGDVMEMRAGLVGMGGGDPKGGRE